MDRRNKLGGFALGTSLLVAAWLLTGEPLVILAYLPGVVIIGTSLWAALDSAEIGLTKYESGVSYSPPVLVVVLVFAWCLGFPWYLHVRREILAGRGTLRSAAGGGTGKPQDWRIRRLIGNIVYGVARVVMFVGRVVSVIGRWLLRRP